MPYGRQRLLSTATVLAIVACLVALAVHAWIGLHGGYLGHVSGVWLSAARDLSDGVLYRPLSGDLGYGGTRYFPLFFGVCALFLRAGLGVVPAAWLTAALSLSLLALAVRRTVLALGGDRSSTALFVAAAVAPYFVQETTFEIRADVLAAGLNILGFACTIPLWTGASLSKRQAGVAALWFTLALAAKVTSLWLPVTVIAAAFLSRRRMAAMQLLAFLAIGVASVLALVVLASHGRVFEVWSTTMFGGGNLGADLKALAAGEFLPRVRYSHLLLALATLSLAVLVAAFTTRSAKAAPDSPGAWLAAAIFGAASLTSAFILSSAGTVAGNQLVEWISIVWVTLAIVLAARPRFRSPIELALVVLVLWMSGQDLVHSVSQRRLVTSAVGARRIELVRRIAAAPAPVLSESALWPVLAERTVIVPDAFAFRVAALAHPDLERDLIDRLARREFSLVVLEYDPASPDGQRMYAATHFTPRIVAAILEHYRFESAPLDNAFVYLPR